MKRERPQAFDKSLFDTRLGEVTHHAKNVEIARTASISTSSLSKWRSNSEENRNVKPSIENLIALAKAYNCSIDYLLGISDNYDRTLSARDLCRAIMRIITDTDAVFYVENSLDGYDDTVKIYNKLCIEIYGPDMHDVTDRNDIILEFFDKYQKLNELSVNVPKDFIETCVKGWLKDVADREYLMTNPREAAKLMLRSKIDIQRQQSPNDDTASMNNMDEKKEG